MKTLRLSRRQLALLNCAPINEEQIRDRSMRSAVSRARGSNEFTNQESFDRAMAALVHIFPIPPGTAEWFFRYDLFSYSRLSLIKSARNQIVHGIGIVVLEYFGV